MENKVSLIAPLIGLAPSHLKPIELQSIGRSKHEQKYRHFEFQQAMYHAYTYIKSTPL
jgi:hypothetical protein